MLHSQTLLTQNTPGNTIPANASPAWVLDLLGKPYAINGRGPDVFDCWGLVAFVYRGLGIELPDFYGHDTIKAYREKMALEISRDGSPWLPIEKPEPFCAVAMSRRHVIHHTGIWLPEGYVMHASGKARVKADTIQGLRRNRFSTILYFRFQGVT